MAKKISASVGKGGKNNSEDVKIVQDLLNDFTKMCGFKKLDVDGLVGPKTNSAIAEFQKTAVGLARPDSRIDPSGDSFSALSKGSKKVAAEIKKAEQAEKQKQEKEEAKKAKSEAKENEKQDAKPQVKGDTRGVDKKILAVLEAVSAHYGKPIVVECGKQKMSGGSASAEALWEGWLGNKIDRGKGDPYLRRNNKLRDQLDTLYHDVKKDEFCRLLAKSSGKADNGSSKAHASGHAIDVKRNTDSKVIAALATFLRYEDEGDVIHFDDNTAKPLPSKIEDIKKKLK